MLLHRNWVLPLVGLAVFVAGLPLVRLDVEAGVLVSWIGFFFGLFTYLRNDFPRAASATFTVSEGAVDVLSRGRTLSLRLDDIVAVKRARRPGGKENRADTTLTLSMRRGASHTLWILDAEARALQERIGPRRVRFAIRPRFLTRMMFALVVIGGPQLVLLTITGNILLAIAYAALGVSWQCLVVAWILGQLRGSVEVGSDGFTIRWPRRRRFVPWSAVTALEKDATHTRVVVAGARELRIHPREAPSRRREAGADRAALFQSMHDAWTRAKDEPAPEPIRALVIRGAQTPKQWLAALDRLAAAGTAGYRAHAIDTSRLRVLADDPAEAFDARIGAATALVRLDPTQRAAVRVAAEASVDATTRERLLEIAEADGDGAIQKALRARTRPT